LRKYIDQLTRLERGTMRAKGGHRKPKKKRTCAPT